MKVYELKLEGTKEVVLYQLEKSLKIWNVGGQEGHKTMVENDHSTFPSVRSGAGKVDLQY